jgi:Prenyltransferase and squalene oxidase repeat
MKLLAATAIAAAAFGAVGLALASTPRQQALIDSTVRFLQESQRAGGGFADPGEKPTQSISAWVALALAGAGINPQDQARCGAGAYAYLQGHFREGFEEELAWPQIAITAFERELLVVDASGTDPHDFAGYDLVGEILGRQLADGSFPYVEDGRSGEANDTIFAVLALSPIDEPAVEAAVEKAAEWIVAAEDNDGGWYYSGKREVSEVDMTGAALEALAAAGPPSGEPQLAAYDKAIAAGLEYLHHSQLPDGGFPALPTSERESNVASTAWAVQGIWATGGNPEEWLDAGREPLDYMESMQQPDGHIRWRASSDLNGIWMTAYVTPAFAGQALPVPPAARFDPSALQGDASACVESGKEKGQSPQPDPEGAPTGGGGHGAPAFSRPKAQSKGKTPGGARVVRGQGLNARDHSDRRRGANLHQAQGTEKAEPATASAADQEAESVSATASAAVAAKPPSGGEDGDDGKGPEARGAALPVQGSPRSDPKASDEEVSGTVIGSPEGSGGKLAFGAPGLRGAGAGGGNGLGAAIAIGIAALLAAGFGVGLEHRRRVLA